MRIDRLEVIPYALPFRHSYRTASGEIERREIALVILHGEDGTAGVGECVPLTLRGGPGIEQVVADLRGACAAALQGAETGSAETIAKLIDACRQAGGGTQALAAIDIALHDLVGKVLGLPIWRLLDPQGESAGAEIGVEASVPCNATLDAGEPERVGTRARELCAAGFETFKVKIGTGDDRARVEAVRKAIGEQARLRVDANGAFSVEQAIRMVDDLEPFRLELFEQPCETVEELGLLRPQVDVTIVADESVAGVADAERAGSLDACDAATVKLSKAGGIVETLRIAEILPTYLSSALDGPVGIAAGLHVAAALRRRGSPDYAHGLATADLYSAWPQPGERLWGPRIPLPTAPGLGIEVDFGAVEELRLP